MSSGITHNTQYLPLRRNSDDNVVEIPSLLCSLYSPSVFATVNPRQSNSYTILVTENAMGPAYSLQRDSGRCILHSSSTGYTYHIVIYGHHTIRIGLLHEQWLRNSHQLCPRVRFGPNGETPCQWPRCGNHGKCKYCRLSNRFEA